MQGKTFLHGKPFRKFTAAGLVEKSRQDGFCLDVSTLTPLEYNVAKTFVFPKSAASVFDQAKMEQLTKLQFADSLAMADAHFQMLNGEKSMTELRLLLASYTIVGEHGTLGIIDLHMDYLKSGESKHAYAAQCLWTS